MFGQSTEKIRKYLQLDPNVKLVCDEYFESSLDSHANIEKKISQIKEKLSLLDPINIHAVFRTARLIDSQLSQHDREEIERIETDLNANLSIEHVDYGEECNAAIRRQIEHFNFLKDEMMRIKGKSIFTIAVNKVKGLEKLIFDPPTEDLFKLKLKIT